MRTLDPTRPADLEALARRRVARKMGFYLHATVYLLVNLGLVAIDLLTGRPHGSHFPMLGWGLGLAIHGIVTFAGSYGDGLSRRMFQRELESLRRQGR